MIQRPLSVTIVAWVVIVTAIVTALSALANMALARAAPLPGDAALTLLSIIVPLVCGAAMLRGRDWARLIYVLWTGAGLVLVGFMAPALARNWTFIGAVALFALILVFLFSRPANLYFRDSPLPEPAVRGSPPPDLPGHG